MKRIDYFIPRQLVLFFGAFWFVGTLPRMLGIVQTKPEFLSMIAIIDTVATVGFFGGVAYTIYAMVHNAKLTVDENS